MQRLVYEELTGFAMLVKTKRLHLIANHPREIRAVRTDPAASARLAGVRLAEGEQYGVNA